MVLLHFDFSTGETVVFLSFILINLAPSFKVGAFGIGTYYTYWKFCSGTSSLYTNGSLSKVTLFVVSVIKLLCICEDINVLAVFATYCFIV